MSGPEAIESPSATYSTVAAWAGVAAKAVPARTSAPTMPCNRRFMPTPGVMDDVAVIVQNLDRPFNWRENRLLREPL
ncbi:hypothetical protein GCM10009736_66190 [Actinomadura bangladeshensis]